MTARKPDPKSLTITEARTLAGRIITATDNNEEATAMLLLLCSALNESKDRESLLCSVEEACAIWLPDFDEFRRSATRDQIFKLRGLD